MNWLKQQLPVIVVFAVCTILILGLFPQVIFDLNAYLLGGGGDSVKNYFVPAWFVKFDEGLTFTGMFYPFTEHVLFPEGPLSGWIINSLEKIGLPVQDQVVGLINLSMFLSYPLAAFFLYKIIRHYTNRIWWSVILSIIIASMSPQFDRFTAHFSLSYLCIIPMIWWFTIQALENKKHVYSIILFFFLLIIGFNHPYLLAIGTLFVSCYVVSLLWFQKKWDRNLVWALIAAIAPLAIYVIFSAITDTSTDRHTRPFGFYYYHTDLKSIFLPHSGYLFEWLKQSIAYKNSRYLPWAYEGWAYIGIFGTGFIVFSIIRFIVLKIKRKSKSSSLNTSNHLKAALLAAILMLIVAFCPFKYGFEWLVESIAPLRQFRSLGRLAWVFFYVFSVFYSIHLVFWFERLKARGKTRLMYIMLVSFILITSFEAYSHLKHTSNQINRYKTKNIFNGQDKFFTTLLNENGYQVSDFQGQLTLPYFNLGNEKIYISGADNSLLYASQASYETGLSMSNFLSGRASFYKSLQLLSMMSHPALPKPILKHFPNNKPLLLVVSSNNLEESELQLIQKAELIDSKGNIQLFRLDLNDLKSENRNIMDAFIKNRSNWIQNGSVYSLGGVAHYLQFAEDGSPFENGIYSKKDTIIFDGALPFQMDSSRVINLSLWLKVDDLSSGLHVYFFNAYNDKNELIQSHIINPKSGRDVYQNWVRVQHEIALDPRVSRVQVKLEGTHITYDSFWIRSATKNVTWYDEETGQIIWNNLPLNDY